MPPPGSHLSLDKLLTALKWKLEDEDDESDTVEMGGPSDLRWENRASMWSQRMGRLKHITCLVASRQNGVAGINHLPPEILSEIFLQVQAEYSNRSFRLPPEELNLIRGNVWIRVAHVCRKWRRCAQNAKALWSRIILCPNRLFPASMASHFFHLSHPLPISLEQALDPVTVSMAEQAQMNKFYNLLLDNPNRISALYLRGYFPDAVWCLLQKSLPNLLELEISFKNVETGTLGGKHPIRDLYIFKNFFGGSPPSSLRKLALDNYTWPGLTPPALTHLYLTDDFRGVSLAEFFGMLASISQTLQALYLKGAGPQVFNFDILPTTERLVMPVLEHFEILSSPFYNITNSLLLLYKLSLPNVRTIIWYSRWTQDLRPHTASHKRMTMLPPEDYLARVTSLVGWSVRKGCYALQGETLYFDPNEAIVPLLNMCANLLPNLVLLAVPDCVRWNDILEHVLRHITTLRYLHIGGAANCIALVSLLENTSRSDFLPLLDVLTINYKWGLERCLDDARRGLTWKGLEPISELLIHNSVIRARYHLQTTYTLRFDGATTYGLFLADPVLFFYKT
ncbi:hypothetical protein GALMADRAFT_148278 [Galerina marginata CBS 339.88]|uniref:F-box domain-containing protein n=1 Tax=Galerina marginata (strain CBS 339.88) TaxID=685588 RepID=A0A067SGM2_GALM3|nr:hypothetical protein GALMADRAFT_148278 [Galerina marginata CBS 339.88]